jgi:hypothetical protein
MTLRAFKAAQVDEAQGTGNLLKPQTHTGPGGSGKFGHQCCESFCASGSPVLNRGSKQIACPWPHFFDAGVFRANRPAGPLDSPAEIDGAALEGLVAQHLRAWCDYTTGEHQLYYWQTQTRNEVDFVLYGPVGFHALEVKNTGQVRPSDLRGLRAFGEDYTEATRWLIYHGKERFLRDGVICVPAEEFLRALRPGAFPG